MSISGPLNLTVALPLPASRLNAVQDSAQQPIQAATPEAAATQAPGVQVSLSPESRTAASASSRDADIEQSGLPDGVQKILKAIRELQRKLEEVQQQMQQVLNDQSLSDNQRQTQMAALSTQLGVLQQQISSSNADLSVLMNQLRLDEASRNQVESLMMAKV